MSIEIVEVDPESLSCYAGIPAAYEVRARLVPREVDGGLGGMVLEEAMEEHPWTKDYDSYEDGGPGDRPRHYDLSAWGLLLARDGAEAVGGAAVAVDPPGVMELTRRSDLATLWDLRVALSRRRQGVGAQLLAAAIEWARTRGFRQLRVETQNVNVPACRFYRSRGCTLEGIDRQAYVGTPGVADEVMLNWYLEI